jgi:hypothetical protein
MYEEKLSLDCGKKITCFLLGCPLKQYFDLWRTCDDLVNARTHVHNTFSSRSFLWAHAGNCSFSTVHKYLWLCGAQVHHKNGVSTHSQLSWSICSRNIRCNKAINVLKQCFINIGVLLCI